MIAELESRSARDTNASWERCDERGATGESSCESQMGTLLVVDDDPKIQEVLSFHLTQDHHSVSVAQTGTTALESIRQKKFDLVLLDLQLPDMTGLHVLMALREIYSQTELPVIIVSGLSESENVIQALEQGANDYITKPINFPEMRARVRAQLLRGATVRESEERYALAARGASDGLWDWNLETNRVYFSSRWKSMLGCAENEVSNHPDEWFRRVHPEDTGRLKEEISNHLEGVTPHLESQHRMLHKDGTYRWMNIRGVMARNGENKPARMAGSHSDIAQGKVADALTGLPNRALFLERLDACLDRVKRHGGPMFAVLFLDVDRFKAVNDSLGHPMGDQLLIEISRRLEACLRSEDTISRLGRENLVARLGGDEFTILLDDIQELSQATGVADRILKELRTPFSVNGNEVFTTVSIGIALSATGHEEAKDLLRDADTAMYQAKAQGKGRCEVFDTAMRDRMQARQNLETELRRAVVTQEFVVHYQPIFSLGSGQLSGFEALVRWQHPDRGLLGPNEFISVAEETGLSLPLDQWVLRQATRQMKDWQDKYTTRQPLTISVNFSSRQFQQPNIVEQVSQVLRETGLDGSSLELEITETQMMENRESVSSVLLALRALSVQLAVDDFGTGYSSLSYIQRFPVQRLKIDRSFVSRMCLEQEDRAIVQTIVALAHNLKLHLVAEGVETEEQLAQLKELGCEYAQGYFFSKPIDTAAAEELIAKNETVTWHWNDAQRKQEDQRLKDVEIHLEYVKKDAMDRFDQERYGECAGIFEFLSELEPENHQWRQYLELSRQLVLEKEPDCGSSVESEDPKEARPEEDLSTAEVVTMESDSLAGEQELTSQTTIPSANIQPHRIQFLSESSVVAVACSELKNIYIRSVSRAIPHTPRSLEMEFAARLKGWRWWVLLLGMTASLLLMAFVTIRTLQQSEKRGQPMLSPNGQPKSSEDQFLTITAQNSSTETQVVVRQGVSKSRLNEGRPDSVSSPDLHRRDRRVFRYPARESAAKANATKSDRASAPNNAKVTSVQNESRGINAKMIELELHSLTLPEKITGLRNENQKHEARFQVHSVVHDHVLGNCQGKLIIDVKSIAFVPSGKSKDEFKSSLSEIIGVEVRDALKIKFRNRTYHFKANTSKGKEANRAEVGAIYRELTRFTK
jgi:diguanylate cyclase (GGDEF)-like protein/PAS domain S-box-containing protein